MAKKPCIVSQTFKLKIKSNHGLLLLFNVSYFCIYLCLVRMISNGNRTEWSTIQGVIGRVISNWPSAQREADLKLRARLPLNCTTRSPITN